MLTHRGFSAWITVADQPLPEYLVAVDETSHRVSCWIPGEEGQTFTVWWRDHGGKVDTCSFITLDGLVVPGRFLLGEGTASRSGVRDSHTTEKAFMFMKVSENVNDTQEVNKEAGTILLRIKRVNRVGPRPANLMQPIPSTTPSGKRKAGDLCIGFGEARTAPLQYCSTWAVTPHDHDGSGSSTKPSTYVSFVFRYRSSEFLEAQGIAPEPKRQVPGPKPGTKRRVASLPLSVSGPLVTPSPSPPKRPRLTGPVLIPDQRGPGVRRPSSEARRTVSWKGQIPNTFSTQGVFILPPYHGMDQRPTILHTISLSSTCSETSTLSDHDED